MYNHSLIWEGTILPLYALNPVRRMHCKIEIEYEECKICHVKYAQKYCIK